MNLDFITKLRQETEKELEALRIVEEMLRRKSVSPEQPKPNQSGQGLFERTKPAPSPAPPISQSASNGNGAGTKKHLIMSVMQTKPPGTDWPTGEIVEGLRKMGYSVRSSNISGELARLARIGVIVQTYRGKDRWDGSKWAMK